VTSVKLDGKEYFENVVGAQETQEPAQGPPIPMVMPDTAEQELNAVAMLTLTNSHMIESGGLDEGDKRAGADIEAAYQSPTPVKYTTIRYQ
jgi:hypothetical protein